MREYLISLRLLVKRAVFGWVRLSYSDHPPFRNIVRNANNAGLEECTGTLTGYEANGYCSTALNNLECGYDGGDVSFVQPVISFAGGAYRDLERKGLIATAAERARLEDHRFGQRLRPLQLPPASAD